MDWNRGCASARVGVDDARVGWGGARVGAKAGVGIFGAHGAPTAMPPNATHGSDATHGEDAAEAADSEEQKETDTGDVAIG